MTWTIQTRERDQRYGFGLHLGHPTRWPQTDQPGIYMAPQTDAIMAMHFPVTAADVWAEGPPGWRLACAPRRRPLTDVLSAMLCYDELCDVGRLTCLACRRWAHSSSSRHRHRVFAPPLPEIRVGTAASSA